MTDISAMDSLYKSSLFTYELSTPRVTEILAPIMIKSEQEMSIAIGAMFNTSKINRIFFIVDDTLLIYSTLLKGNSCRNFCRYMVCNCRTIFKRKAGEIHYFIFILQRDPL